MSNDLIKEQSYIIKKHQLLQYLSIYIRKQFNMNDIFVSIRDRISEDLKITQNQFLSMIKFLEREKDFIDKDRRFIIEYFYDFIQIKKEKKKYVQKQTNLNEFIIQ